MIIQNNLDTKNIKHVFFDIDGTLTRWINVSNFLKKSCEAIGLPYKDEFVPLLFKAMKMTELEALISGKLDERGYELFLASYIDDLGLYNLSGKDLKEKMFELEPKETFISSDVIPTLDDLKQEYLLYCYTNWYYHQAKKKLIYHNLDKYFEKIYAGDRYYLKFTKVGFHCLLYELKAKQNEILMIGDAESDIDSPKRLGIQTIYLNYDLIPTNIKEDEQKIIDTASSSVTEFSDIGKILAKKQ